jgi:hypothetical protein
MISTRHHQKFIITLVALAMAFYLSIADKVTDPVVNLFWLILVIAFGGNVWSKYFKKKEE